MPHLNPEHPLIVIVSVLYNHRDIRKIDNIFDICVVFTALNRPLTGQIPQKASQDMLYYHTK
jgi:hypothetical protein